MSNGNFSPDQEVVTKDALLRLKADFEARMNSMENEMSELLKLHHSRISTLRDFILQRLRPKGNDDQETREVMDIFLKHEGQTERILDSDQLRAAHAQQIQELQAKTTIFESLARAQDNQLKEYINEVESLKEAVDTHKRKERCMDLEIEEKDAQIAILNNKISQLLDSRNRPRYPSTPSGFVEKDLPCPAYQVSRRSGSTEGITSPTLGNVQVGKTRRKHNKQQVLLMHRADTC